MVTTSELTEDLISDILSRLPAKTLVCLKLVCKSWNDLISDGEFANSHLEKSLVTKTNLHYIVAKPRIYLQDFDHLPEPLKLTCPVLFSADFDSFHNPYELSHPFKVCFNPVLIRGTCRGLVLLLVGGEQLLLLYNPTTQSYNSLPSLNVNKLSSGYANSEYGIGYDSVSKDYKCVRITMWQDTRIVLCHVYSLNSNSWRVSDVPCYFSPHNQSVGVLVNGNFHWVGTNSNDVFEFIVAFNFRDEKFSYLPLPKFDFDESYGLYVAVGMLDGCLCLLANCYRHCQVWIMKEYGVAKSWTKMFVLQKDEILNLERIVPSLDKKRLLFSKSIFTLGYIDVETMNHTNVVFLDWDRGLHVDVYVENLRMMDYSKFGDDIRSRNEEGEEEEKPELLYSTTGMSVPYVYIRAGEES